MKRLISILALAALPLYANEPQTESVRGTVLYCQPWQFFLLKTEDRVVRVQTKQGAPELSPGDLVEARGVPARRNGRITVEAARYEKKGENGVVPETQSIGPKDLPRVFDEGKTSDLYGMPVRLKARVLNVIPRDWAFTDFDIDCEGIPHNPGHRPARWRSAENRHQAARRERNNHNPRCGVQAQVCRLQGVKGRKIRPVAASRRRSRTFVQALQGAPDEKPAAGRHRRAPQDGGGPARLDRAAPRGRKALPRQHAARGDRRPPRS